ncbi:hypothetical protein KR51_00011270 [Rubidibacter lacunae KORDI 51-2]|uniref:Uncharacterized protein n=1 Tax=Rubidibacter lacunae KORDI 51-2 TaxID=582515 RepID=U5DCE1_9CHRO|nr:hypothetical protein [Rubidibacter lacunae]ERN42198.1 hypothetical protein KR51_00011270 [Rubidibacter lacunae KORDI 51-2]
MVDAVVESIPSGYGCDRALGEASAACERGESLYSMRRAPLGFHEPALPFRDR